MKMTEAEQRHANELRLFTFIFGGWRKLGDTEQEAWENTPLPIRHEISEFVRKISELSARRDEDNESRMIYE